MARETLRPDVQAERAEFITWMEAVDPTRLVFVDESGIRIGTRLAYGYAPCGKRVRDYAPLCRGKRMSIIGWLDAFGTGQGIHLWHSVKRTDFRDFVEEYLVPDLRPGDIVIWDNARIHEDPEFARMIERRGAELKKLPRYSPDLNPIEMLWSKLKHYIRKTRADTEELLADALKAASDLITFEDAVGWLLHCGFRPQPA